jgi:hypothetical protein
MFTDRLHGSTDRLSAEDRNATRPQDPILCLGFGDVLVAETRTADAYPNASLLRNRNAKIVESPVSDDVILFVEQNGAVVQDLQQDAGVLPQIDGSFQFRAFPEGVVSYKYEPDDDEADGSGTNYPTAAEAEEAIENATEMLEEMEAQYVQMVEEEYEDSRETLTWGGYTGLARRLLRDGPSRSGEMGDVRWVAHKTDPGEVRTAVEFPDVKMLDEIPLPRGFGCPPDANATHHNHWTEYVFSPGVRTPALAHTEAVARMVQAMYEEYERLD